MILRIAKTLAVSCLIGAPGAMASSSTVSFTNDRGKTITVTRSSTFDRATRTSTQSRSVTSPLGHTATASVTSAPDGKGGLTISRSVTGFDGQTHTSSHTVGR